MGFLSFNHAMKVNQHIDVSTSYIGLYSFGHFCHPDLPPIRGYIMQIGNMRCIIYVSAS